MFSNIHNRGKGSAWWGEGVRAAGSQGCGPASRNLQGVLTEEGPGLFLFISSLVSPREEPVDRMLKEEVSGSE